MEEMTEEIIASQTQSAAVSQNVSEEIRRNIMKRKMSRALFIISFIILPLASFGLFYIYVNFSSFTMAFQTPENGKLVFAGWENFEWVIDKIKNGSSIDETQDLGIALINTLKTFGVNMIMYPIGLMVAYFVYKKIWGYKYFRVVFYLPSIISGVVVSIFFKELMSPSGFFPGLLTKLYNLDYELRNPLADSDFANKMVFLHLIWLHFPGSLIIWGGTFSRIPDSLIESARLDGIGWVRELFQIIIPLVWPTLTLTLSMSIAGLLGATGAVFLLTGGGRGTNTLSNWMYMQVQRASNPMQKGLYRVSALGLMMTVISCTIAFTVKKFLTSRIEDVQY